MPTGRLVNAAPDARSGSISLQAPATSSRSTRAATRAAASTDKEENLPKKPSKQLLSEEEAEAAAASTDKEGNLPKKPSKQLVLEEEDEAARTAATSCSQRASTRVPAWYELEPEESDDDDHESEEED